MSTSWNHGIMVHLQHGQLEHMVIHHFGGWVLLCYSTSSSQKHHGRYRLAEYASFLTTRRVEFPQPAVIRVKHTSTTWIKHTHWYWSNLTTTHKIRNSIINWRYCSLNEGKSCFITCSSFIIDSMIDLKRSSKMRPLNFARRKMMKTWRSQANWVSEDVILMCWIYPRPSNSHHQDGIPVNLHLPLLLGGG